MLLTKEGIEIIEHQADKRKNVNLMLLVQILKELREVKMLLEIHQNSSNCSNNSSGCTDDCKN
ncbi:hypothetical protein IMSAGC013_00264 [Lachnospiraceae bacterium]|nr:hypothetical protein IMSAGC013_00264 [Lachnospiraceae bacterium]